MSELRGEPPIVTLRRVFGRGVDYPLVFRELIQNADDCQAEWLAIGFSEGIPDAEHQFLRVPGLFAVNNGPLRPRDVEAISSLSLGTKIADAGSVGKFGLGLKSVYKFAEMMFFADFRLDPNQPKDFGEYGPGEFPHFDVLSPWLNQAGRKSRQDWEPFNPADRERLGTLLRDLGIEKGFAVWVPLRRASDALPASILSVFDEDISDSEKAIGGELLRVFPLLQHLRTISFKEPGQSLRTLQREGGTRQPLKNDSLPFEATANGELKLEQDSFPYVFQELLRDSDEFTKLKASEGWPNFTRYDEQTGDEFQVADPAIPHAGVVWQRLPANAKPVLEIGYAVFLPLSDRQTVPLNAPNSYRLTLHGYFFPTDDRLGIVSAEESQLATGESRTKGQWNQLLKTQLIAPRILEGLPNVTGETAKTEITELSHVLGPALKQFGLDTSDLTSRHQWAKVWTVEADWQLLPVSQNLLPLHEGFWEECWTVAVKAAGELPLYDPEAPNIIPHQYCWPADRTRLFLVSLNWEELLNDGKRCAWLQKMLNYMTLEHPATDLVTQLQPSVAALRTLSSEASRLLRALVPEHTASLPVEAREANDLLQVPLSLLLLPHGHGGKARLTQKDCDVLLEQGKSFEVLATILRLGDDRKYLQEKNVVPVGNDWLTPTAVLQRAEHKTLFLKQGKDGGLLDLVNAVLPQPLEFVEGTYNDLFEFGVQHLNSGSVLLTLKAAERLTDQLSARIALFKKLCEKLVFTSENRSVFRYLLHGQASLMDDFTPLIYDNGDYWGKMARLAVTAGGDGIFFKRHSDTSVMSNGNS